MERMEQILLFFCLITYHADASHTLQPLTAAAKTQHDAHVTHRKLSYDNTIYAATTGAISLLFGASYLVGHIAGKTPSDAQIITLSGIAAFGLTAFYTHSESQRHARLAAFYLQQEQSSKNELKQLITHKLTTQCSGRTALQQMHIALQAKKAANAVEALWPSQ